MIGSSPRYCFSPLPHIRLLLVFVPTLFFVVPVTILALQANAILGTLVFPEFPRALFLLASTTLFIHNVILPHVVPLVNTY